MKLITYGNATEDRIVHWLAAIILGAAGAVARYFHEIMTKATPFVWYQLPMVIFIGGFLGYMGSTLALAQGMSEHWAGIFAGALGASGAYGFELLLIIGKRAAKKD